MLKICRKGHLTGYKRCPQCGAAASPTRLAEDAPDPTVAVTTDGDRRLKRLNRSQFARWIAGPHVKAVPEVA